MSLAVTGYTYSTLTVIRRPFEEKLGTTLSWVKQYQKDEDARYVIPGVDMREVSLSDSDRWVLNHKNDADFPMLMWDVLANKIANNDLDGLQRTPSELKRYIKWGIDTHRDYGSVMNYLMYHRFPAAWGTRPFAPASEIPFEDANDYCILTNEWPYALEEGIVHLVVWTRAPIETDNTVGDMTPKSRAIVDAFIERTFRAKVGKENVLWFKNWAALQSVRALAHVHVMLQNVDQKMISEWTSDVITPKMLAESQAQ